MHPDAPQIPCVAYPAIPSEMPIVAALDQITYNMNRRLPAGHSDSTDSPSRTNLDSTWFTIYDAIHRRWHDIAFWIQHLVSQTILSGDPLLEHVNKELVFLHFD